MVTPFLQLNLSSVEHVRVEYHVPESTKTGSDPSYRVYNMLVLGLYSSNGYTIHSKYKNCIIHINMIHIANIISTKAIFAKIIINK
jgi:hypothetical protein